MLYAKSNPVESIQEHINKLINNMKILESIYGDKILRNKGFDKERFFYLLRLACLYHDVGKVYTPFQNKILKSINKEEIPTDLSYSYIKHEQLSPLFIPFDELDLQKEEIILLMQSIYFHHERNVSEVSRDIVDKIIKEDILPRLDSIQEELDINLNRKPDNFYLSKVNKRIKYEDDLFIEYCLLKGLLHRIDHSSSANIVIESESEVGIDECAEKYLTTKFNDINELQKCAKESKNKNIIVLGSTGIGKTEAALLWSGNEKVFFTLPIRISINAIYDRIRDLIEYDNVGLLHSSALDYLENKNSKDLDNEIRKYEESKHFASKVTTCTIDQIFPFVFKYKGYEKVYSTFSYANIIIDEIQAYNPEIVAIILKGLEMINRLGGKFMIMTATLPSIYKEELNKMGINFEYGEYLKDINRHKICIKDKEVSEDINEIIEKGKKSKVLVIVNTVNKAIELYDELSKKDIKINLFHSRFIWNDRNVKENDIKEFSINKEQSGVWITTQIVEASLDIDFDYLYTEMSTLDSLFQRMGRCYRSREYNNIEANVYIYTCNVSGIKYVYDEDIFRKSIELLREYNGKILLENDKVKLVDILYSKEMLEGTDFLKKFKDGLKILNEIVDYSVDKGDAQRLLRNIDNVTVIPQKVYNDNLDLFKNYEDEVVLSKRYGYKRKINELTVSISRGQASKFKNQISPIPYIDNIFIINLKYDENMGLILKEDEEYSLSERFGDL